MRTLLLYTLLAVALAPPASAKKNDIDADKSKRRVVTDPMDPSDCKLIYKAAGGRYFPRAPAGGSRLCLVAMMPETGARSEKLPRSPSAHDESCCQSVRIVATGPRS